MSSASAEPVLVPEPLIIKADEVLIVNPADPGQEPAVIKAVSLVAWIKRGWEKAPTPESDGPVDEPTVIKPPSEPKSQDAAKPSSTKNKEH